MRKYILTILLIAPFLFSYSQDYHWWNVKHNWDGITHWSQYIIMSPSKMGPNAIPVPKVNSGLLINNNKLELAVDAHFSKGDNTQNIYTDLNLPIVKDKIGLNFFIVPYEQFELDTITRDERRVRLEDGKGSGVGDLYISTQIQLLKNHTKLPDLLLGITLKTASGSNLGGARFTDTPGYYFDISAGKAYKTGNTNLKIRPFGMIGFYVWQTNRNDYYQNDAVMYGAGLKVEYKNIEITNNIAGLYGYINNGDHPLQYRFILNTNTIKKINYKLMIQKGLKDFEYLTIRLSALYSF